jgi:HK97 family phage prohead protease
MQKRLETRPYEGEHAARIRDPEGFDSFRRVNNEGGQGVDFVYGIRDGEAQVQSIRFKIDLFTVDQAREWLEQNNFDAILFEPAAPIDEGRGFVVSLPQSLEAEMDQRAEPGELSVGDYVTWDSSGGEVYGRIQRIVRDGEIDVPDTDFTIIGTEDDPAALIMVYREVEDGWSPSGTLVGHKFSTLTKVSARYYDEDGKKKRHIKRIEETETEVIVVFGKSEEFEEPDMLDADEREMRPTKHIEVRTDKDGGVLVAGYAAVFGEETSIGGMFTEVIEQGAFRSALDRGDDVVFLINHDGLPLARTRSGTLRLTEDERGLYVETYLDPSDPDVRSILPKMRRGDLDKMSFAFIPTRQAWDDSGDMPKRMIQDVQLYDVSIVTTPAYDGTEIGLRSLQQHRNAKKKSQAARRLRMKSRLAK